MGSNRVEAFHDAPLSPQAGDTIGAIIARRYMLEGSLGVTAATRPLRRGGAQSAPRGQGGIGQ